MQNPRQNLSQLISSALVHRGRAERNGIWEATLTLRLFPPPYSETCTLDPFSHPRFLALPENIIKLLPSRSVLSFPLLPSIPTPYRASHSLSLTFLHRRWMSTTSDLSPSLPPAQSFPRDWGAATWCVFTRNGISSLAPCPHLISLGITDTVPLLS